MNRKLILLGVSLVLMCVAACTTTESQAQKRSQPETSLTGIVAIMPPVDDPDTKSDVSESSGRLSFSWNDDDVLGIVPLDGKTPQTNYELSASDEGAAATFDGGSWAVKAGHEYAAYLPYQAVVATSSDYILISLDNQVQVGNNNVSHLGNYNIMYASGTATADDAIQLSFSRLAGFFRFEMEGLPAGTYTSLVVSAEDDIFATSATLDLEAGSLTPANMTNTITLQLKDVVIEDNDVLNAWMASAPVPIANKTITVTAVSTEGSESYIFRSSSDLTSNKTKWPVLTKTLEFCQLPSGSTFNAAVVTAAGGNAGNVTKISFKTGQVVTNTTDGYDITFDSATGEVTVSTSAEEFKLAEISSHAFEELTNLTELDGLENLNTDAVTSMSYMFRNCRSLESIDLSNFNTSLVTNMNSMFLKCSSLTSLDLSSFDTGNVTNMSGMFTECSSLTSLDLSSFDTGNVTDMSSMFFECSSLTSLDLSSLDVSKLESIQTMFRYCSNLEELNFSGWNHSVDPTTGTFGMSKAFDHCENLSVLNLTGFDLSNADLSNTFNYLGINNQSGSELGFRPAATIICSEADWMEFVKSVENANMYQYGGTIPTTGAQLPAITEFRNALTSQCALDKIHRIDFLAGVNPSILSGELINSGYEGTGVYISSGATNGMPGYKDITIMTMAPSYVASQSCQGMFSDCTNLTIISGFQNVDTGNVTDMSQMFYGCINLTDVDTRHMNTSNVTDMHQMFASCSVLPSDGETRFNSFETSRVTNMSNMFYACSAMTELDLSSFSASSLTNLSFMLSYCENLQKVQFGDYFTLNEYTNIEKCLDHTGYNSETTFYCQQSLWDALSNNRRSFYDSDKHFHAGSSTTLPSWTDFNAFIASLRYDNSWDAGVTSITFYTRSAYTPNKSTAQRLTSATGAPVYVERFHDGSINVYTSADEYTMPTDMSNYFSISTLQEIHGLDKLNTSGVTSMSGAFQDCAVLRSLDLSSWDVYHVTNMNNMLSMYKYNLDHTGEWGLEYLDISGWNTSNVTNMQGFLAWNLYLHTVRMSDAFRVPSDAFNTSGDFASSTWQPASFESIGSNVSTDEHDGYNTTFYYCPTTVFQNIISHNSGRTYRNVGRNGTGFSGGENGGNGGAIVD